MAPVSFLRRLVTQIVVDVAQGGIIHAVRLKCTEL